jgi:hypothetical protein
MRAVVLGTLVLLALTGFAQNRRETYQATARGTGTQMGRMFSVNIIINQYSNDEERATLLEAFSNHGSRGLSDALTDFPSKGHIAITGTIGYDIAYVRVFPTETGRKIRILTNRRISIGEARNDTRSRDYDLSAIELDLSAVKGDSKGALLPACMFTVDQTSKEIIVETYQNPWDLVNIIDWAQR